MHWMSVSPDGKRRGVGPGRDLRTSARLPDPPSAPAPSPEPPTLGAADSAFRLAFEVQAQIAARANEAAERDRLFFAAGAERDRQFMQMMMQMNMPRSAPAADPALLAVLQGLRASQDQITARLQRLETAYESDEPAAAAPGGGGAALPFSPRAGASIADVGKAMLANAAITRGPELLEKVIAPLVISAVSTWRDNQATAARIAAEQLELNRQTLQVLNGTHGRPLGVAPPPSLPIAPSITVESAEVAYPPPTLNGALTTSSPPSITPEPVAVAIG